MERLIAWNDDMLACLCRSAHEEILKLGQELVQKRRHMSELLARQAAMGRRGSLFLENEIAHCRREGAKLLNRLSPYLRPGG